MGVALAVAVAVRVAVGVRVAVAVTVGVLVGGMVALAVGVLLDVGVALGTGVKLAVGVGEAVAVPVATETAGGRIVALGSIAAACKPPAQPAVTASSRGRARRTAGEALLRLCKLVFDCRRRQLIAARGPQARVRRTASIPQHSGGLRWRGWIATGRIVSHARFRSAAGNARLHPACPPEAAATANCVGIVYAPTRNACLLAANCAHRQPHARDSKGRWRCWRCHPGRAPAAGWSICLIRQLDAHA